MVAMSEIARESVGIERIVPAVTSNYQNLPAQKMP